MHLKPPDSVRSRGRSYQSKPRVRRKTHPWASFKEELGFLSLVPVLSKVATLYPQVVIVTIDDNAHSQDASTDGRIGTVNVFEVTGEQSMGRCVTSNGFVIGSAR